MDNPITQLEWAQLYIEATHDEPPQPPFKIYCNEHKHNFTRAFIRYLERHVHWQLRVHFWYLVRHYQSSERSRLDNTALFDSVDFGLAMLVRIKQVDWPSTECLWCIRCNGMRLHLLADIPKYQCDECHSVRSGPRWKIRDWNDEELETV